MPNYNRNYSLSEFDLIIEKYAELIEIRKAAVSLTGLEASSEIVTRLNLMSEGLWSSDPAQKYIYVVQSKSQLDNNSVKVGFCKDISARWGKKWESFVGKEAFVSPFNGDAEVHLHLRQTFERDLENGRETYFGDFNEIANAVETFISIRDT